jgi:hypothetical protein
MKISKMCVTLGTVQLQVVVTNSAKKPCDAHEAGALAIKRVIGNQNTLMP